MPAKLDRCVKSVTKQRTDAFVKKNKRQPNTEEKKKIRSSAFAICDSSIDGTLTGVLRGE